MSQVLCPSCATPLNPNDQFCGGCGMRVTGALPQTEAPQSAPLQAQAPAQPTWPPQQAETPAQPTWPPQQAQTPAQPAWPPQAQAPAQQPWPQQAQAPQQPWPQQAPQPQWSNQQAQNFGVQPLAQGGVVPAGFGIRFLAQLIDGVILAIPQFLGLTGILGTVIGIAYFVCFWVLMNGQTPGKMVLGLRVVSVDGKPLDWSKAAIRYVGMVVSGLILGIGFIMVAFDSKKQGLHDKIAGTVVVKKA